MELIKELYRLGAKDVSEVMVSDIPFDISFVQLCEQNACGNYGKNYCCPPHMGPPEKLIAEAKTYQKAYVFETVGELEDSYDFEGMMEAAKNHQNLCRTINDWCKINMKVGFKTLANGTCNICDVCAVVTSEPCRFPESALSSLDTCCIFVSELARIADMNYINGQNTVTYFGLVFVKE